MPLGPSIVECLNRARADLRMGVPVVLTRGAAGVIAVALSSSISFFIFYKNRTNLALLVFTHGFYDTIGLTLIYLNKDRLFYEWAIKLINF